jgi:hypothetical protein
VPALESLTGHLEGILLGGLKQRSKFSFVDEQKIALDQYSVQFFAVTGDEIPHRVERNQLGPATLPKHFQLPKWMH